MDFPLSLSLFFCLSFVHSIENIFLLHICLLLFLVFVLMCALIIKKVEEILFQFILYSNSSVLGLRKCCWSIYKSTC